MYDDNIKSAMNPIELNWLENNPDKSIKAPNKKGGIIELVLYSEVKIFFKVFRTIFINSIQIPVIKTPTNDIFIFDLSIIIFKTSSDNCEETITIIK